MTRRNKKSKGITAVKKSTLRVYAALERRDEGRMRYSIDEIQAEICRRKDFKIRMASEGKLSIAESRADHVSDILMELARKYRNSGEWHQAKWRASTPHIFAVRFWNGKKLEFADFESIDEMLVWLATRPEIRIDRVTLDGTKIPFEKHVTR